MRIKVKHELSKSLNHEVLDVRNKTGEVIQVVGDGFCLIRFDDIKIPQTKNGNFKMIPFERYVHDTDFYLLK